MKFILGENTRLYFNKDDNSFGEELSCGEGFLVNEADRDSNWIKIEVNKKSGYIKKTTSIFDLESKYIILDDKADIFEKADISSKIVNSFMRGKEFKILAIVSCSNINWVLVSDFYGNRGYLRSDIKFMERDKAYRNNLIGEEHFYSDDKGAGILGGFLNMLADTGIYGGILIIIIGISWYMAGLTKNKPYFPISIIFFGVVVIIKYFTKKKKI